MIARRLSAGLMAVGLVLAVSGAAAAALRYDPRLRFRTISTARFDIHYHQGEEALARRLARIAEETASAVDAAVGAATGRVQIILVDQHDLSNGWATPVPYNTIEITTAAPDAENSIGNTDDWLKLVFIHEYTHIAHLSRAGGWIAGLRRGFGRLPLLFPNLYQPIWGIEGIATWQESVATGEGRVRAGDFRLLLDRAAAAGRFEPIDRVNGGNVDWPGGAAPYLYGAYFHDYLAGTYGADSVRRLAAETSRRLPYFAARAYRKVYGRPLGQLWSEFEAAARNAASAKRSDDLHATRLTHHGFTVSGPRYARDGRIFYSVISPHHFPALMELPRDRPEPRHVARRYLGNRIGLAGEALLVDEIDIAHRVALQSDLYLVDPRSGRRQRVTIGARAADPDVAADGRSVVCTVQMTDRRALATFALPAPGQPASPTVLVGEASTQFAGPRWSPDGASIAAERRVLGGAAEIVLIDAARRTVRRLAALPGGRSASPVWTPDGASVLFSAAAAGEPFRIHRVDVATGALSVLRGTGSSAQSPDVSPDGTTIVFVGYTADGYDLFSLPLTQATWEPVRASPPPAPDVTPTAPEGTGGGVARTYRPWRTLVPQFWTPTIESDAGELVAGAATGSADALGRHAYGIEAGWGARARPDWQVVYAYDRWWPTLFAAVTDDTDPWQGGEARTRELDAGMLLRDARVRSTHITLAAIHAGRDTFECGACTPAVAVDRRRVSLRAGWDINTSRTFGYSVSPEEGGRFTATLESTRRALGADGNGLAITVDGRRYWSVRPHHAAIAIRAAAAGSWGDRDAERVFSASGSGPQTAGFGFGVDAVGLLRGFDEDDVIGTRAVVVNADYRLPLARIDRGVGTIPLFLRSIHGALFVDAGTAWTGKAQWSSLRTSLGAELSADAVIGFALPVTFATGAAWTRDGRDGPSRIVAFARLGRAF